MKKQHVFKSLSCLALLIGLSVILSACTLAPKPSNDEIKQAIVISNAAEVKPLELDYNDMEVPQRGYGKAKAVLWIPDKSIQRNYSIAWDAETKQFYVLDYITLERNEDKSYYGKNTEWD